MINVIAVGTNRVNKLLHNMNMVPYWFTVLSRRDFESCVVEGDEECTWRTGDQLPRGGEGEVCISDKTVLAHHIL